MVEFVLLVAIAGGGMYVWKKKRVAIRRDIKKWLEDDEKEA
jgi:hypothetical protein